MWDIQLPDDDLAWAKDILNDERTFIVAPVSAKRIKTGQSRYVALIHHAIKQGFAVILVGAEFI